jgi:hypothetical protein
MIMHGITENSFIYTTEKLLINLHHSRIQNYSQVALVNDLRFDEPIKFIAVK